MASPEVSAAAAEALFQKIKKEAAAGGYLLNPDDNFARELVAGLLVNEQRWGYQACPCRLPSGVKSEDLDIICPCDYRDPDLNQWGACYCALYVSGEVAAGRKKITSIPERRPVKRGKKTEEKIKSLNKLTFPVWRCKVCGYLCAREEPPDVCPICKVPKERFERFI